MSFVARYWGLLVLLVLLAGLVNNFFGPPGLILLSSLTMFYFLFNVPNWCGAWTRQGTLCRDNANGLLLGCHRRQHKWQIIKLTFIGEHWRRLGSAITAEPLEGLKIVEALAGVLAALVGLVTALVKLA